jgi:hypothetical protein
VQELKYHLGHFLRLTKRPSRFSLAQRFHHLHHGFGSAQFGLTFPLTALSMALATSMIVHHEIIPVPFALWFSVTALFLSNIFLQWLQYRVILRTSLKEMLYGMVAHKALSFSMNSAAFGALMRGSQQWHRTNKFRKTQTILQSLRTTRQELLAGLSLSTFAVGAYVLEPFPGLLAMCLLGILYKSFDYLMAPVVAIIAVRSQRYIPSG